MTDCFWLPNKGHRTTSKEKDPFSKQHWLSIVVDPYYAQIRHGHGREALDMVRIQILLMKSEVSDTTQHNTLPILKYRAS